MVGEKLSMQAATDESHNRKREQVTRHGIHHFDAVA
jgi:hypothetical protein